MKPYTYCLSLFFACGLNFAARAEPGPDPNIVARHLVAEIDQSVLTEQYHHVQMEAFKARMELQMIRLKMRHASGPERESVEQALGIQEARLELLEELTVRTREELIHVTMERVELETQAGHPEHRQGQFEGSWSGQAPDGELVNLTIRGDHARLESGSGDEWFETEFHADERDDGLWNVALRIVECSDGDYKGKTSLGLAELGDGRLVMALGEPGTDSRPTSMDAGTEEAQVIHLERR